MRVESSVKKEGQKVKEAIKLQKEERRAMFNKGGSEAVNKAVHIIGLSQTGPGGLSQSFHKKVHISQKSGTLTSHKHLIQRLSQTKLLMLYHKIFLFEALTNRGLLHLTV